MTEIDNIKIINYLQDRIKQYQQGGSGITKQDHDADVKTLEHFRKNLGRK